MYQYNIDFLAKKKPRTDLFTAVKIELKTGVAHELILIPQGWTFYAQVPTLRRQQKVM
jgi:hypothetical protein